MTTITMPTMTALRSRPALLLRWALVSFALLVAVGVSVSPRGRCRYLA
jgi:hypothetical protein